MVIADLENMITPAFMKQEDNKRRVRNPENFSVKTSNGIKIVIGFAIALLMFLFMFGPLLLFTNNNLIN
jgi:hypothetical protein